jgi:nitrate/nitrite transport system substrate-binding protein
MSRFENRLDPERAGCVRGFHRSQRDHDDEARLLLQCAPVETGDKKLDGLLAGAALRSNFGKPPARRE